ncbi:hypothetical protein, partial [Umezawaea sp. NPDC059074]|uniref:hypothetical protein n=1 Tax=Umezawaea sp. NPDC059074 TaxID=3346716 RepID=UPI0036A3FD52
YVLARFVFFVFDYFYFWGGGVFLCGWPIRLCCVPYLGRPHFFAFTGTPSHLGVRWSGLYSPLG